MDTDKYYEIINDLRTIQGLHANETFFNVLFKKYESVPEDTLRSIIGLWFQRKVSQTSYRVKDVNIYDLYKQLIHNGTDFACLHIAKTLDYPPSLVAKIVLTSYVSSRSRKSKTNIKEINNLRKQQCTFCRSIGNSVDNSQNRSNTDVIKDEIPLIKRHDDPRVELALNLFDEDDEIGKYFLDKFAFSRIKTKKNYLFNEKLEGSKSNKFFWQASSFEEMGEKNVKKYTNVEKLFSESKFNDRFNPNCSSADLKNRLEDRSLNSRNLKLQNVDVTNNCKAFLKKSDSENFSNPLQNHKPVAEEGTFSLSCRSVHDGNSICTSNSFESVNDSNSISDTSLIYSDLKGNEFKVCSCISSSNSEDSDTDSADSEETYENFNVKELLENPSLIEDPRLANDVFLCTVCDDQYGPISDIIANSSGITYEKLLEECVDNAGLPYKTENKLRGVGVDKTPDIILLVPVAVNGFVINWVESKALFADFKLHQDFEKNQFKNYINRFGPGLVIYWHGYVAEIRNSELVNKQIIVRDGFPSKEAFTFVNSDKFKLWMQCSPNTTS